MKSISIKALIFLIVALIPLCSCFAVKIDGIDVGVEWENAEFQVILNDKDSNNVNFGSVSYIVDDNGFDIYFMIFFSDFDSANYDSSGVILTLGSDVITVDVNGNVDNPKPDLYHIEAAVLVAENDGCYCELLVGYKLGLPANLSCKVSFIDGEGTHSYHYPFVVVNEYAVTTTAKANRPEPYVKITSEEKTTKAKTTKAKTTRHNVTRKANDEFRTTEASTVAPVVTTDVIAVQPVTIYVTESKTAKRTTKAPVTTDSTTKLAELTKKSVSKTEDKTVVYYFEKEVIISEVYVTSDGIVPVEPVCDVYSEIFMPQQTFVDEKAERYNNGVKIFRVVCVISGLLLGVFAVWTGLNHKKTDDTLKEKFSAETVESDNTDEKEEKKD